MKKGILYIIVATFMFSVMEVAIKLLGEGINPIQLNFLRFAIGGFVLLPMALKKLKDAGYRLRGRDYGSFAISGLACVVISMTLFTWSLHYIPAYFASVAFCTNTFFSIIMAEIFLKEKTSKLEKLAILVAFVGILVIINPLNVKFSSQGMIIILMAAFTFSAYSVMGKSMTGGRATGGIVLTCGSFLFGILELGVVMAISHIPCIDGWLKSAGMNTFASIPFFRGIGSSNIAILLFISICVTGIGFASYFIAIEFAGVTVASTVFFIKPILAPILAMLILGETIIFNQIIGIGLMFAGSMWLLYLKNNHEKSKSSSQVHELAR